MILPLTKIAGVPSSDDVIPGMAFFPNTGPFGRTCGECAHKGYRRQSEYVSPEGFRRSYAHGGCAMFRKLTGRHGPPIKADCAACKYFEPKPEA